MGEEFLIHIYHHRNIWTHMCGFVSLPIRTYKHYAVHIEIILYLFHKNICFSCNTNFLYKFCLRSHSHSTTFHRIFNEKLHWRKWFKRQFQRLALYGDWTSLPANVFCVIPIDDITPNRISGNPFKCSFAINSLPHIFDSENSMNIDWTILTMLQTTQTRIQYITRYSSNLLENNRQLK